MMYKKANATKKSAPMSVTPLSEKERRNIGTIRTALKSHLRHFYGLTHYKDCHVRVLLYHYNDKNVIFYTEYGRKRMFDADEYTMERQALQSMPNKNTEQGNERYDYALGIVRNHMW